MGNKFYFVAASRRIASTVVNRDVICWEKVKFRMTWMVDTCAEVLSKSSTFIGKLLDVNIQKTIIAIDLSDYFSYNEKTRKLR